MPRLIRHMTLVLISAGMMSNGLDAGISSAAGMDVGMDDTFASECEAKIEKSISLITIPAQALALDQAKLLQRQLVVIIPLKTPQGDVTAIHWRPKDTAEGMDFIRYLQTGKIRAVNVLPFLHHPADMYVADRRIRDKIKDCQKESIIEAFGKCTECEVIEWLNVKP